jgi:hypothetical protein
VSYYTGRLGSRSSRLGKFQLAGIVRAEKAILATCVGSAYGALQTARARALIATSTVVAFVRKRVAKPLQAVSTTAAFVRRGVSVALSAVVTTTASLVKRTYKILIDAVPTFGLLSAITDTTEYVTLLAQSATQAFMRRALVKRFIATATNTARSVKQVGKALGATSTALASLLTGSARMVTLMVSSAAQARFVRQVRRRMIVALDMALSVQVMRHMTRRMVVTVPSVARFRRHITKFFRAVSTSIGKMMPRRTIMVVLLAASVTAGLMFERFAALSQQVLNVMVRLAKQLTFSTRVESGAQHSVRVRAMSGALRVRSKR